MVTGLNFFKIYIPGSQSFITLGFNLSHKKHSKFLFISDDLTFIKIANQPHIKNLSPLQQLCILSKRNFKYKKKHSKHLAF